MCIIFFISENKDIYLNCPIFQQCLLHTRSTTLLNFLSMFVKYQDNLIIPFSDNVCDKSSKLCHCSIPISDNVCDRSTTLSNFLRMCVTYQENCITVSSLFPTISGQLSCQATEKKKGGERKEKITAVRVTTTTLPFNRLTATHCNAATCAFFLKMGMTYHKNCITSNKPSQSVDCVQIIFFYFLLGLNIMFSVSNHSLVASIETKRKVM